jgi:hypothetical protein
MITSLCFVGDSTPVLVSHDGLPLRAASAADGCPRPGRFEGLSCGDDTVREQIQGEKSRRNEPVVSGFSCFVIPEMSADSVARRFLERPHLFEHSDWSDVRGVESNILELCKGSGAWSED